MTGDARFYARSGPHTLAAVARAADAVIDAGIDAGVDAGVDADQQRSFAGIAPLQTAGAQDISFLDNRKYLKLLAATRAGAVILHPDHAGSVPAGCIAIVTPEPYIGWARVAAMFHPAPPASPGVHPSAVVDPTARVDPSAEIGPLAVIGRRTEIGPRCRIGAGAVLGDGVVLGADCRVGVHVSLSHAVLGARVTLHPGARVGQEGFGFATTKAGFLTVPQLGRVILEDDVEIGANSTIDRGSAQDTVIGAGSRLDNLVQVGHNVRLGRCCVLVAQVGLSGSTEVGDFVMMGGQAGLTGHLRIGDRARIGAKSGVMADVPAGAEVVGAPAMPVREFFRQVATLKRLAARGGTDRKTD